MKSSMALAVGLAAVLAAVISLPAPAAFAATINVDIVPGATNKTTDAFSPNPVNANVGDTIVWTNKDSTFHTVVSGNLDDGPSGLFGGDGDEIIGPNKTQEWTATEEGEYEYYCSLHPAMVGTVVVGAGGGGDEPTTSTATAELGGNSYEVTSTSADNSITAAEIAAGESVTLTFDGPGAAEVTLPKSMVSGSLMVDGAAAEVVNEDDQSTTISVTVPDSGSVEITGATVVPEFGVIAALVLAVSLVAVIGVARFKGNLFGLGRF
ncbi:plastocyanin/azurin family copper-binding protein [Nitrososphaera sp.]|uniref:plastocyanin/azurin family copper-binding protein n=1 Tax=Nitrososphaera sp. TaxID=1971748 RepID=UPI001830D635|nr:plastocyanin/azurin family copper-binding protein [Nitrososphaera sp.]NWG37391.1 cupredoxin domain-containing protein [Nitrososphaera sp.]